MTEPHDDLADDQAIAELFARAFCTCPNPVEITTTADADRRYLCQACGDQWTERRP
ncbi:hypothetical protein [Micromonospora tulbaghiae]|uniref:hypothetical protein n=1 Tax=Micromonospora tulbaghiae TaxID=479978 RepID=UPI0013C4237C|nr:hypothetical protein [Micromonospora tulbaghiae]